MMDGAKFEPHSTNAWPGVVCQKHPQEDEQGTKNEPQRYWLAKDEPGKDDSSDWIQIDIVGSYYGT